MSDNSRTAGGCTTTHPPVSIGHCPNYLNIHQKKINYLTICAHFFARIGRLFIFDFFLIKKDLFFYFLAYYICDRKKLEVKRMILTTRELPGRGRPRIGEEKKDAVVLRYNAGTSPAEIAKKEAVSIASVYRILKERRGGAVV